MRNRLFSMVARGVLQFPRLVLAVAILLTGGSVYLTAAHLPLHTDQDDLVSESLDYHRRYKDYLREFGDQEYLYLVVETGHDRAKAKAFVQRFVGALAQTPGGDQFREILYRIDNPAMEKSFLLYLPTAQLRQLAAFFAAPATGPKAIAQWHDFATLFAAMNGMLRQVSGAPPLQPSPARGGDGLQWRPEAPSADEEPVRRTVRARWGEGVSTPNRGALTMGFTFLDTVLDGMAGALRGPDVPAPRLDQLMLGGDRAIDDEGYLLSADGRFLFVLLMPTKNYATLEVIEAPLRAVRTALAAARDAVPGVAAGLTGRPVLQADEMAITHRDMTRGTILALCVVTALFTAYFRRPTRPVMAVGALTMGIAWTYGFAALAIGYLNILSIVFGVVLVGAGIEYGLQIVARYREELAHDGNVACAITTCITQTGRGNLTACLTTAAAFFAALGTQFLALRELGLIAGVGILLCLVAMLTVLPALLYLRDRHRPRERLHTTLAIRLDGLEHLYQRPRVVLAFLAAITIAALPGLWRLRFDHNLLNLQAHGLESVAYEMKLITESDQSTWYTPFLAASAEAATALAARVHALPSVKRVETVAEVVPEDQAEKLAAIAALAPGFRAIEAGGSAPEARTTGAEILPATLDRALQEFATHIDGLMTQAFQHGEVEGVTALEEIADKVAGLRTALATATPAAAARLVAYQQDLFRDLQRKLALLADGMHPQPIALSDLPVTLQRRYVSAAGRHVIYAYPRENLWEPSAMAAYIREIRSIDPAVTGVPVEVYESSRLLERSFRRVAGIAFCAICLLAWLDFRRIRHALLAILPLGAGILWLLEVMGWIGLPFTMANFFAIPILIGVGVDNGIQLIHRYRQEGESSRHLIARSTGTAVLLTSVTTLASFAMLCTAAHRGIFGLGLLMSIGTVTCLIGSLVLLPCVLRLREGKSEIRNTKRETHANVQYAK